MAVTAHSVETFPDCLSLFELPRLQKSIIGSFADHYPPTTSLTIKDVIEFTIPETDNYIYPAEIFLYLKCQIVQTYPPVTESVPAAPRAACNSFFHSLFDRIEIDINGTTLNTSLSDNAYKAFFYNLFSYSSCVKETLLRSMLWIDDNYEYMSSREIPGTTNEGMIRRHELTGENQVFEVFGRPMCDLFMVKQVVTF
jgi:hypothetical protein